jgi:hypothetical protein
VSIATCRQHIYDHIRQWVHHHIYVFHYHDDDYFFYFFDAKSNAEYSQPTRTDEFEELSAIGAVGTPPIWIAATVICGSLGLVYIGAMSPSKDEAMTLLSSATESVRLAPNGSKPAK